MAALNWRLGYDDIKLLSLLSELSGQEWLAGITNLTLVVLLLWLVRVNIWPASS